MKHNAFDHPKFDWAAADLGIPVAYFRGCMATLWNATKDHHPAGDIGRESNKRIAWRAGFPGDAELFVSTLVEHGFLDQIPDEQGRLYVHNWHVHCEDFVRSTLRNRRLKFANGHPPYAPRGENHSGQQRTTENHREPQAGTGNHSCVVPETGNQVPETKYRKPETRDSEPGLRHGEADAPPDEICPLPASETRAEPEPTAAKSRRAGQGPPPAEVEFVWGEFVATYPGREGDLKKPQGRLKFDKLLRDGLDPALLLAGAARYLAFSDATGKTRTPYVQQIPTWLNSRGWENDWQVLKPPVGANGRAGLSPQEMSDRTMAELRAQGAFAPAVPPAGPVEVTL